MTTPTLTAALTARRTRLLTTPARRRYLVPVVLGVVLVVTEGLVQAVTPFIRQDDWPFLLPPHAQGVLPVSYYDRSEGRWLNTVWWTLIGQHGNATSAALTYAVAYLLLVAGMWRVLHHAGIRPGPVADVVLGVALYASAVWVQLLYWPGTLTPSVVVGAAVMWLLPWAARSRRRLLLLVLLAEVAAVLTYPPVGAVVLAFAVVLLRTAPWRRVLTLVAAWLGGFALAVLVAYTLNWVLNGHFRLELAPWRQPDPLTSVHALTVNVGRWFSSVGDLWAAQWWVALVGLAAIAYGWRDAALRPRFERLLVAFAVALGLDATQTLITGVVTEPRGQLWTWLFGVLPAALLLPARRTRPLEPQRHRPDTRSLVAVGLLGVLAVGGVLAWRADIGKHQAVRQQYAALAERATAHAPDTLPPVVIVYQDPSELNTRSGHIMASTLMMAVRLDQGGRLPPRCSPTECFDVALRLALQPADRSVVRLGTVDGRDLVAVVVPTPPSWI